MFQHIINVVGKYEKYQLSPYFAQFVVMCSSIYVASCIFHDVKNNVNFSSLVLRMTWFIA